MGPPAICRLGSAGAAKHPSPEAGPVLWGLRARGRKDTGKKKGWEKHLNCNPYP